MSRIPNSSLSAGARENQEAVPGHAWVVRIMESEGPALIPMLWRILGSEADVMDAYQDCFCKLATSKGGRTVRKARAYLFRTATNVAIEILRARKRRQEHWPAVVDAQSQLQRADSEGEDEDERFADLRQAIQRLPTHLRNVLMLRDFGGLSYCEVGKILGIGPATARVYRRGAVVKLTEMVVEGEQP